MTRFQVRIGGADRQLDAEFAITRIRGHAVSAAIA
jgi:hypothetical protein